MSLPDNPIAGPHRQRQGTMGHKVEAGTERVRHHVPRPHPNKMITDQIRSTVYRIDPQLRSEAARVKSQAASSMARAAVSALTWGSMPTLLISCVTVPSTSASTQAAR